MPQPATATAEPSLEVSHLRPGQYAFGALENVHIGVWLCQATARPAQELGEVGRALLSRYPGGVSAILWMLSGTELPTAGARKHFTELLRTHGRDLGEVGVVLDGGGFWASAVRAMLTGLRLAFGGHVGFRVEGAADGLLTWFPEAHRRRTGVALAGPGIVQAVSDLVARTRA